ncbi:hypothetical protein [Kitasatospora herbaricolor]|uniref:hypothetical protein n=1 Tax=Kitasatospora herbaricolor TaxID=68217 RepID=UPI0036DDC5F4
MSRLHPSRTSGALQALGRALREWPGWFTLAAGALLCVLGWYGVSGERLPARQLPFLASATVPGAALIVAGAVLIAARQSGGGGGSGTARRVEQLYSLLVGEPGPAVPEAGPAGPPLALPDGTLYHRRDCPLVAGKTPAVPVDAALVAGRGLAPCPVCEPDPPAAPPAGPPAAGPPAGPPAAPSGG